METQLDDFLRDEKIYWRQRSKAVWLKEGDRNTRYFHAKASSKKRKNTIDSLLDINNQWREDILDIENEFSNYFTTLFTSSTPSQLNVELALQSLEPKVTAEMNSELDKEFSPEEIKSALFQMHPSKAPGLDGLSATFFQRHWNVMCHFVTTACLEILNGDEDLSIINHTYVVLISKVKEPKRVHEYMPISLCNIIYKIISKCIANRLKVFLEHLISPFQSAFIPQRHITDNVIIGYECLHKIRCERQGKEGLVALKLYISKAYDRIEWCFLEGIMFKLGLSTR